MEVHLGLHEVFRHAAHEPTAPEGD
jgi:hypothetical protein